MPKNIVVASKAVALLTSLSDQNGKENDELRDAVNKWLTWYNSDDNK